MWHASGRERRHQRLGFDAVTGGRLHVKPDRLDRGPEISGPNDERHRPVFIDRWRGNGQTVPVNPVCSAAGAPDFDTPQEAMTYLASAWNTDNVEGIDYVTDPAGRQEMDSMASLMVNLQFKHCTENPAGDYTCYFSHNIAPSTSPTTYPNPDNFPPGEAVFTVAPAGAPGWYLTNVIHCG